MTSKEKIEVRRIGDPLFMDYD